MPNAPTARRGRIAQLRAMIGRILANMLGITQAPSVTPATFALRRYGRMGWQPPRPKGIVVGSAGNFTSGSGGRGRVEMRVSTGHIGVSGMMDTYLGRRRHLNRDLIAGRERGGKFGSRELAAMPLRARSNKAEARAAKKAATASTSMLAKVLQEIAGRKVQAAA